MIKIFEDNDSYNLERRVNEFINKPGMRVLKMDYQTIATIRTVETEYRENPLHIESVILYSVLIEYSR